MKKKIRFMGIAAIVAITVFLVSCGDPTPCNVKHPVGFTACGGNVINCKVHNYGSINGIPVYRTDNILDEDVMALIGGMNARDRAVVGYNNMIDDDKVNINSSKVSAIHLDNANGITADGGKWIIRLLYTNGIGTMTGRFEMYATVELAEFMQQNGVRMADNNILTPRQNAVAEKFNNVKRQAVLSKSRIVNHKGYRIHT